MSASSMSASTTSSPSDDPLAGLNEEALHVLLIIAVVLLSLVLNNFVEKWRLPIPSAIVTVLIGVACGGLGEAAVPMLTQSAFKAYEASSARQFMLLFIMPIIFAEGYGMKSIMFFENLTRILLHAFLGTAVSAVVVAFFVFYLPPVTGYEQLPWLECLTFGSLISATDPVTTLAIFKDVGLVEQGLGHLYFTVLGESILNDAVGITLFDGFDKLVQAKETALTWGNLGTLVGGFLVTFLGSMVIGIVCGMFAALLLKFALLGRKDNGEDHYHFNVPEIGTAFAAAYLPFILASSIEGQSGIVAVLFAGITMRHYAHYNLTQASRNLFLPTVELFATLAESYAFIILGLGVFLLKNAFSASVICWAIVGCLIGRFMNVYPLSLLVNCSSKSRPLKMKEMHVVWFAGLRGAIAFMCAMRFPDTNKHRDLFLSTTMVITFLSMVTLGWPTASVLRCLDLKGDVPAIDEETAENNEQPLETPKTRLIGLTETGCAIKVSDFFSRVLMTQEAREERTSCVAEARLMRTSMSRISAVKGLGHQRVSPLGLGLGDRISGAERVSNAAERVSNAAPGNRASNALSQARSSQASNGSRTFRTLCNP